jgi:hypothetical protein
MNPIEYARGAKRVKLNVLGDNGYASHASGLRVDAEEVVGVIHYWVNTTDLREKI